MRFTRQMYWKAGSQRVTRFMSGTGKSWREQSGNGSRQRHIKSDLVIALVRFGPAQDSGALGLNLAPDTRTLRAIEAKIREPGLSRKLKRRHPLLLQQHSANRARRE